MDPKLKLLGPRSIEVPVKFGDETTGEQTDTLVITFKSISPNSYKLMTQEIRELRKLHFESIENNKVDEKVEILPLPNEISFLLTKTLISFRWKSDTTVMRPGVDFDIDSLDERVRSDVWAAIDNYTFPKSNA